MTPTGKSFRFVRRAVAKGFWSQSCRRARRSRRIDKHSRGFKEKVAFWINTPGVLLVAKDCRSTLQGFQGKSRVLDQHSKGVIGC